MKLRYLVIYRYFLVFADINVSQGSVATCLKCGEIFKQEFAVNLLQSPLVKKFRKSGNSW